MFLIRLPVIVGALVSPFKKRSVLLSLQNNLKLSPSCLVSVNMPSKVDPNSFANPEQCQVTEIDLHLNVDFTKQILSGYVDLTVERNDNKTDSVVLDSLGLTIHNVKNKNTMKKMNYELEDPMEHFGSKFVIKLPRTAAKKCAMRIEYETSPEATALQWLEPMQTAGKKHPFMYSQCQAIHARSMLPCQDTPGVKATYTATITAPAELQVLMSGVRDGEEQAEEPELKTHKFVQKIPIPSYLIAIAIGALEARKLGPRSSVWAEKEYVDKAAYEFAETDTMLKTAEELLGPYVWEIYDILVLPPSFPYGGMENPCLTFVTPTLLAGDRSLADVIAHEISHSWTGNLITNRNFEHFWLNEGFTMFVERKILGRMYGESHRHFNALNGWKHLEFEIETLGKDNPLTKLVLDLNGVNPDDSYNLVPYENGHTFLFYLEELLGGAEVFDPFLKAYVEKYKMQSIDTDDWKTYLYEYFKDKKDILDKVDWDAWLYSTGMPPITPNFDKSLAVKCGELCKSWIEASPEKCSEFCSKDIEEFSSCQIQEFLDLLLKEKALPEEKMKRLTEAYKFENVVNAEVRFRWIRLGLRACWKPIIPHAIRFVTEQGRMRYIRPIYRDMYAWEETRELAISTYKGHFKEMMYVAAYSVANDLHLKKEDLKNIKV